MRNDLLNMHPKFTLRAFFTSPIKTKINEIEVWEIKFQE